MGRPGASYDRRDDRKPTSTHVAVLGSLLDLMFPIPSHVFAFVFSFPFTTAAALATRRQAGR